MDVDDVGVSVAEELLECAQPARERTNVEQRTRQGKLVLMIEGVAKPFIGGSSAGRRVHAPTKLAKVPREWRQELSERA